MTRSPFIRERMQVSLPQRAAPGDVAFTFWAWRDCPVSAFFTAAGVLLASWLTYVLSEKSIVAGIALLSLLACTWRTWLPIRREFGLGGISEIVLWQRRRIPWIGVVRYEVRPGGVWLYARRADIGENYDGLFIEFGNSRDAALACIEYYLGTWTASGEMSTQAQAILPKPGVAAS